MGHADYISRNLFAKANKVSSYDEHFVVATISKIRDSFKHVIENCCGCSGISAEPIYHSLVLELYAGLVFRGVRLTNNLANIISRLDVLKACNFNFVD